MSVLPTYISVHHVHVWCLRMPEEASDLLELEFLMLVSHLVGTGD